MAPNSYGAAKELADKIEADGLCCLCDYGENYRGHGEVKVVPFPFDVDRDLIVKALRAYGSPGPNDAQDAERYRWLRNGTLIPYLSPHVIAPVAGSDDRSVVRSPEELDAALDLAMKRTHATGDRHE